MLKSNKEKKIALKEDIVKEYVELKLQIKTLESKVELRKAQIKEILLAEDDHEIYVPEADTTVTLKSRPTYEYSKKVQLKDETIKAEQDILKMMKKEEEETGKAKLIDEGWYPVVK